MQPIQRAFAALSDHPCWGVKRGVGSFLTFEFGEPRLVIREPIQGKAEGSRKLQQWRAQRRVFVRGQWHLWIYCCDWRVWSRNRIVGDSSTVRRINSAAKVLDGQKLIRTTLAARGARTRFEFDLGAILETRPYNRSHEQWMLYEPSGFVLTLKADRTYGYQRGDTPPAEMVWKRVPP